MNQKFINLVEKTQKKAPIYEAPKSKRFARKRSQQSDRSVDSKKSRQTAIQPVIKLHQLDNIQLKNTKVHINTTDFFQQLANSVLANKQPQASKQRYARGRTDRINIDSRRQSSQTKNQNFQYHNQALTAELEVRNKELEVVVSQCQMIKESLKNQEQKRRKLQSQKKQLSNQLSQKIKQFQKIQIDNKKLVKEKQYLIKQIEFLQKINYDDKTRNAQSYRQKYLAKELQELRKQINMSKTQMQRHLQSEIKRLLDQKYSIEKLYNALKVEKQTLIKQFQKQRIIDRNSVLHSQDYVKLRQKYKMCLDAYKRLKIQYIELQKELNRSLKNIPSHILNSNSSLSIVLSSSSSQKSDSSLGKQNKCLTRMKKNNIFFESTDQKTPIKKSLSPKNRDDKQDLDFKKPISPVSHKKSYENADVIPPLEAKSLTKSLNNKTQKKQTFFNEQYRLKIGLAKNLGQK